VGLRNTRDLWASTLRVLVVICILPLAAFGHGKKSPENPTVVLGLLGGASLFWQYVRSRTAR